METREKLRELALSETGFVFDPLSGTTFTVNETGLAILQTLKAGGSHADALAEVLKTYDVSEAQAERDLRAFYTAMRHAGVLPTTARIPGEPEDEGAEGKEADDE